MTGQLILGKIFLTNGRSPSPNPLVTHHSAERIMNKRVWLGFIAVFITGEILDFIVHGLLLGPTYQSLQGIFRADMMSKMYIFHIIGLIGAFFFAFIFSKGYEGKGVGEGIRYGVYIGIWMSAGMAYGTYGMIAIPYSLALQWFIYGVVEYLIMGVVLALVYGRKLKPAAS